MITDTIHQNKRNNAVADKNSHEAQLAERIHEAERAVAAAAGKPASGTRVSEVQKAERELLRLQQAFDFDQTGQARPPVKLDR